MPATMDIIVSEGRDRKVYPGASEVKVSSSLPEYRGGMTMTIRFAPQMEPAPSTATITVDPNVRGGVPCVGGGRWPIAHILQNLASGISSDRLTRENPDLTLADIQLALDVASWVLRDPAIDWPALDLSVMADFQHEIKAWQSLSDEALGRSENMPGD